MLKSLFTAAAIAAGLAGQAVAGPLDMTGTANVALALESDQFRVEYVHPSTDEVVAHDHAMYHAAQFMLRMGYADFQVETAYNQTAETALAPTGTNNAFTCGTFVCSSPLPRDVAFEVSATPKTGETLVVIEIAASHVETVAMMQNVNAGRIVHNLERAAPQTLMVAQVAP